MSKSETRRIGCMERGSSVVECRTRRGNVSDLALARNCYLARMLPGEAELVSE